MKHELIYVPLTDSDEPVMAWRCYFCGGIQGQSLTTECRGVKIDEATLEGVARGIWDYVDGMYVRLFHEEPECLVLHNV